MALTGLRVCAFDFDGTLVDTMGGFGEIAAELIAGEHGVSLDQGRRLYRDTSGLPFFQQLDELFPGNPANARLAAAFEARKLEGFFRGQFFPDVPAALARLRAGGVRVAVCSNNGQDNVQRFVAGRGVAFDHVLGYRPDFYKGPPHFDHLLATEGVGRDALLLVGDSLKDADKAAAYGIPFVARAGTFPRAAFAAHCPAAPVLDTLTDLPGLLGLA